jgi:hypothetical protein
MKIKLLILVNSFFYSQNLIKQNNKININKNINKNQKQYDMISLKENFLYFRYW